MAQREKKRRKNPSEEKYARLKSLMKGKKSLLVVLQDFPDPDAIAASAALKEVVHTFGDISATLACGGFVSRSENRALVKYLDVNLQDFSDVDIDKFDIVGMLDTQPGTGNNALPVERVPEIVIDHHPMRAETRKAPFHDVRKHYGATSTILYEYLLLSGASLSVPLATALAYGINSDTNELGVEASKTDIDVYLSLYRKANTRMLGRIRTSSLAEEYFDVLSLSLNNARVFGCGLATFLGEITDPDMVAEVADLFLRNEKTVWALCYGVHDDRLLLSLRTSDEKADAGAVMQKLVRGMGTGGGHAAMAGGQVPRPHRSSGRGKSVEDTIIARFLTEIGEAEEDGRWLVKLQHRHGE